MKQCIKCSEEKPEEEFSWRSKTDGIRSNTCKVCQRLYTKSHYKKNAEAYKARAKISKPQYHLEGRAYMIEYLQAHPCVDCGESDIEVLQFDHIELVGNKAKRVYDYAGSSRKLREEIAKCEVRCGNCHIRRTRRQLGWSRMIR